MTIADPDEPPEVLHITVPSVRFPVVMKGGFGQIEVKLEPGESETIMLNGRPLTIIRDYLH